jgi:hypothetical protein
MMNTTFPARCLGNTFAILFKSWPNNALLALSGGLVVVLVALSGVVAMGTVSALAVTGNTTSTADSSYVSVTPYRVVDTRTSSPLAGGATLNVQVTGAASGVPAGAVAAVLNVTAVDPTAAGFLTVFPEGTTMPTVSNLNFAAGTIAPNLVTVGLSASGMVSIYLNTGSTNVVVDVEGYYVSPVTTSGLYNPLPPSQAFGSLASGGVMVAGQTQAVTVAGATAADGVPATANAVVLNVTAAHATLPSFLTVFPAGVSRPLASNLNFGAQTPLQAIANRVTVGVGMSGQIDIYNLAGTVNVDVDVDGYYSGPGGVGSPFVAITPVRVADTRTATQVGTGTRIAAGHNSETFSLANSSIPANSAGVATNMTVVPGNAPGYITAYPTSGGAKPPVASDVNWTASEVPAVPNFTIADTVGTGAAQNVAVANSYFTTGATINVIIDAFGYFAPVILLPQTISFSSSVPTGAIVGGDYTPTADSTSGLTVVLTIDSTSSAVCSISSGLVSFNQGGTCVIDANQAGNANYLPASQEQQSFSVGKVSQTIVLTSTTPSNATVGGATYTPTATASSGLTPVTLTVDPTSSSVCSIDSNGLVSFQAAGTCIIDANQAGNGTYSAAPQVQQSFTVSPTNQWELGSYDTTGAFSYTNQTPPTFNFKTEPTNCTPATSYPICGSIGAGTALLVNTKDPVVGAQLDKTITATFTISGAVGEFAYGGEPYCSSAIGGSLPNVRLYFESASIVGTQVSTNYWWSDTASQVLANGTFTVTALIDPTTASWGDINGDPSGSYVTAFDAAANTIKDTGLSFGGGCFFVNGVGTTDGSGTFVLTSLTVS